MKKKLISMLLATAMLTTMAAGCGGNKETSGSSNADGGQTADIAAEDSDQSGDKASTDGEKITLTQAHWKALRKMESYMDFREIQMWQVFITTRKCLKKMAGKCRPPMRNC